MFNVSRSGYNTWVKNGCKDNKSIDRLLISYIKEIRDEGYAYYGCRMIREEIKRRYGIVYGKDKINRHIHLSGYKTKFHPKKDSYNIIRNANYKAENLLNRDLETLITDWNSYKDNELWTTDITTLKKIGNKIIKAVVIMNVSNRKIIGISIFNKYGSGRSFRSLLRKCLETYGAPNILHSDRGAEFWSNEAREIAIKHNYLQSFNDPHSPTQNVIIERFFRTLKESNLYFENKNEIEIANNTIEWIQLYNNLRYHSQIKTSPNKYAGDYRRAIEVNNILIEK